MYDGPPKIFIYDPPKDPPNILYQDDDILVLNKPSGLLHVPGKDKSLWDCLEYRVKQIYPRASVVHRLDKDTSGVVVMALHKTAHAFIGMQFENRETRKSYIARVYGHLKPEKGYIDYPLAKDFHNRPCHKVDFENGKPAHTDWEVLEYEGDVTRVRLFPRTGRTHQLRIHMFALCHPILGDEFYAKGAALKAADRLQLHAEELSFTHPTTKEVMTFRVEAPF
jgi:tRNA pseudouridine32 synthase / 23S rRNA pseudouridine746 synthase